MNAIQTLLTDHLDIWTAADTEKKSGRGRSAGNADRVYGIGKLRELILELAVRGKLVPQDPNDEPASVLLMRIQAEKNKLVAEGKIKKGKPVTSITGEEKLFELPQGWVWARLDNFVLSILSGGTPSKNNSEYWNGDIPWASVKDLNVDKFLESTQDRITKEGLEAGSKLANKGDLLICTRMGLGKIAIATMDVAINQDLKALKITSQLDIDYFINFYSTLKIVGSGMTVAGIKQDELLGYSVPTPPLAEQHRIVAKVDELMALCDQLEQQQTHSIEAHQTLVASLLGTITRVESQREFNAAWARIASHFDTLFTTEASIAQLKQILLQLAVMGKLVPQDPNDEPAYQLLKRIDEAPKSTMRTRVTDGEEIISPIEDKHLFDLPTGWEWALFQRLPLLASVGIDRGRSMQGPDKSFAYLKMNNIRNSGGIDLSDLTRIDATPDEVEAFTLVDGDFLFNTRNSRELVGKTCVFRTLADEPTLYNNNILRVKLIDGFSPDFLDYWFRSPQGKIELEKLKSNTTNVCAIYQGKLAGFPCVIPPIAEQHRIVAKVDELMALCDALKARLADAQAVQLHLADAIVEQAVC